MTPQGDNVFDYVVVGSGAGGGPLAANLARDGFRVLLLEAGPGAAQSQDYLYSVPVFHALACEAPEMCWEFFVKHYGDEARQAEDSKVTPQGVLYPRAGTLGGCTAHNAMITILPHPSDWDYIASVTGDDSWLASNMQGYFEKLERCTYVPRPKDGENPTGHGFDGWLSTSVADAKMAVTDPALLKVVLSAAETAIAEHVGHALPSLRTHFDPNDARVAMHSPEGLAVTPLATRDGHRNGTREFILETQRQFPDNLVVRTNCLVTRVLFDAERRATGVEYLEGARLYRADPNASRQDSAATRRTAQVSREVILSGGAFNSPQLLMLSGVGPRAELERFGIPVVLDLPGVGENLQDRYEVGVVSEMRFDFRLLAGGSFRPPETGENPDTLLSDWLQGKGPYTTNGAVIAVVKRSKPERPVPDLIIFGLPGFFRGYYPGFSQQVERDKHHFTWAILKAHTNNHAGTVRLRSADPLDTPEINFHYFDEGSDASGEDLESVVEGVEFVRRMNKRLGLLVRKEALPGEGIQTRDQLREFIRREAWGHHASCSNKMGPASDPAAVVDSAFRVHGTKGLRVVDASVFPRIPGFFIVSAIYMISEKAAAVIAADARRESAAAN